MTDMYVVRCELCLGEDGQPWRRRELNRCCAEDTAAAHRLLGHPVTLQFPPPERTTDNVQRLLRKVGGAW